MTPARRYRLCTWIAGIASLSMGTFHLFLPQVFGWGPYVNRLPPAVHWGVYSINCFFSVLLILGALLSLRLRIDSGEAARLVPLGMSVFWAINAIYQILIPFPMPRSMQALRWAFLAFPIVVGAFYAGAFVAAAIPARRPDAHAH
ncbi:MAG: hypothetical protein AABO58_00115 [Acidobacteriota bacterium]